MIPWIQGQQTETGGVIPDVPGQLLDFRPADLELLGPGVHGFGRERDVLAAGGGRAVRVQLDPGQQPRDRNQLHAPTADTNAPVVLIVLPADLAERTWVP